MPNYNFRQIEKDLWDLREGRQPARHNPVVGIITEKIDTNSAVGIAIFSILASISQLERDLIADRVKIGLANARAKGKLIGRKKLRDSDLIRKLLKSGLTFRQVAAIAKCSHGSIWAEKKVMLKEEAEAKKKLEEQSLAEKQQQEPTVVFPQISQPRNSV